jgi:hypothetical protein
MGDAAANKGSNERLKRPFIMAYQIGRNKKGFESYKERID